MQTRLMLEAHDSDAVHMDFDRADSKSENGCKIMETLKVVSLNASGHLNQLNLHSILNCECLIYIFRVSSFKSLYFFSTNSCDDV